MGVLPVDSVIECIGTAVLLHGDEAEVQESACRMIDVLFQLHVRDAWIKVLDGLSNADILNSLIGNVNSTVNGTVNGTVNSNVNGQIWSTVGLLMRCGLSVKFPEVVNCLTSALEYVAENPFRYCNVTNPLLEVVALVIRDDQGVLAVTEEMVQELFC